MLNQIEKQRQAAHPVAVEKAARRHEIFREVNERIADLTTLHDGFVGMNLFICECSNDGCAESIEVSPDEYQAVRAHGNRFLVLADHQLPGIERVVGGNGQFLVIETVRAAGEVASVGDRGGS